ncbi:MAG: pyruvate kinase [Holdemanella sp.]|nr:pyruvate kinase [Holdemanella sp.]
MRKLKVYGTLGPSCHTKDVLIPMFECGMTGVRLNLSHVDLEDVKDWVDEFHKASKEANVEAELLVDMQGPEIRLGRLEEPIGLNKGDTINIYELPIPDVIIPFLKKDQILLMDDGKITLKMMDDRMAEVIVEGVLLSSKSIALPGVTVNTPTLTLKDVENLKHCTEYGVTGIMQPFVRDKEDLMAVKDMLHALNLDDIRVFAKIENMQGYKQLEELLPYCDEIIIARGDLGNATTLPVLPSVQRKIETICKKNHKPYMIVTEMLYSMISKPTPTRAEVSDIYHAVYNGASSIMLTGEVAAGKYPIEAMEMFTDCAKVALRDRDGN